MKPTSFRYLVSMLMPVLFVSFAFGCSSSDNDGTFPLTPESPASIHVAATKTALNSGESTAVTASVYDRSGNPVGGVYVEFILDDPTKASITHTVLADTDGAAVATFTARDLPGQVHIRASVGSVFNDPAERISISGIPAAPTLTSPAVVTLSANDVTLDAADPNGNLTNVNAIVVDSSGNPVPGVTVAFTLDDPTLAAITPYGVTDENGEVIVTLTAKSLNGEVNVTATSEEVSSTLPETIYITGGSGSAEPIQPVAVRVTAALDTLNAEQATQVKAFVYDESGNTIPDVGVVFTLDNPEIAFITHNSVTDSLGEAIATLTARDAAGEVRVSATVSGAGGPIANDPAERVIVDGTLVPDPSDNPATVYVSAAKETLSPGVAGGMGESTNIIASVYDASGDPIIGVEVTFALNNPAMAQIESNAVTSAPSGQAIVQLTARDLPGEFRILATAGAANNGAGKTIVISGDPIETALPDAEVVVVTVADADNTLNSADPEVDRTTTVSATVYDESGHKIPGLEVVFSLSDPTLAEITHTVITSASGEATATFVAGETPGTLTITATVVVESTGASLTNATAASVTIL